MNKKTEFRRFRCEKNFFVYNKGKVAVNGRKIAFGGMFP